MEGKTGVPSVPSLLFHISYLYLFHFLSAHCPLSWKTPYLHSYVLLLLSRLLMTLKWCYDGVCPILWLLFTFSLFLCFLSKNDLVKHSKNPSLPCLWCFCWILKCSKNISKSCQMGSATPQSYDEDLLTNERAVYSLHVNIHLYGQTDLLLSIKHPRLTEQGFQRTCWYFRLSGCNVITNT